METITAGRILYAQRRGVRRQEIFLELPVLALPAIRVSAA
jgi:hypothetical protein